MRALIALSGILALVACRGDDLARRDPTKSAGQTASAYSTGTDSGARRQQLEGTNTGTSYQAPPQIAGMTTTLTRLASQGRTPTQADLTSLRNQLGSMADAMRSDLSRAGLADTGEFRALSDSLAQQLGGGAGGLAHKLDRQELPQVQTRIQRLITVYNDWMATARR
jgi:hypothetical protein